MYIQIGAHNLFRHRRTLVMTYLGMIGNTYLPHHHVMAQPGNLPFLVLSGGMELQKLFVKKFKRSFCLMHQHTKLNFAELNCAITRIANILNDRPVSAQRIRTFSTDKDFLSPLTPNMLITGQNHCSLPLMEDDCYDADPRVRSSFIKDLETAWWDQYKVQCFGSLVPTRKWIEAQRNLSPGDIVLIQYASRSSPGTYRLGRVTSVEVDAD